MRFVWKGKFKSKDQLSLGELPENAVKYREPETTSEVNKVSSIFVIPVIIVVIIATFIKHLMGNFNGNIFDFNWYGFLIAILTILPHEILHGICFPKKAEVEIWYSLKGMMAFVISTSPVSKRRFIFLSLLPNIILGVIPLMIWIFIPNNGESVSSFIYTFAVINLSFGVGDYMNVYNTITQVPKGATTQLSGFHSYWYIK